MPTALLIALGGAAGVLARYGLTVWVQSIWTVVAINLVGSFLLGLLVTAAVISPATSGPRSASACSAGSRRCPRSPSRPSSRPTAVARPRRRCTSRSAPSAVSLAPGWATRSAACSRESDWRDEPEHRDRDPRRRLLLGRPGAAAPPRRRHLHPGRLHRRREREPDLPQPSGPRRGGRDRLRPRAHLLPGHPRVLLPDPRPDDQGPPGQRHRLQPTAPRSSTRATSSVRSPRTRSPTSTRQACGRARS